MLVARGPSPSVEGDSPVWAVSSSSGKFWSLDELVRSNRFASLIGIAKLRFSPPLRCKVVIPITSPAVLNNGPPLLPGEMGAVICKYLSLSSLTARIPLTIPFETVDSSERGLPMATTSSPTCTRSELPKARIRKFWPCALMMATSRTLSNASTPSTA